MTRVSTRSIRLIGTDNTYRPSMTTGQRIRSDGPIAKVRAALSPACLTPHEKARCWIAGLVLLAFVIFLIVIRGAL